MRQISNQCTRHQNDVALDRCKGLVPTCNEIHARMAVDVTKWAAILVEKKREHCRTEATLQTQVGDRRHVSIV